MTNPRNATTTTRGRTYEWNGETFDSVTTIISGGVPKGFLTNWAKKLVAEAAVHEREVWAPMSAAEAVDWLKHANDRVSDAASDVGSEVHDWAEAKVLGKPLPPLRKETEGMAKSFERFLAEWEPEYEATEATTYSREHGYAGTFDAVATVAGRRYLIDYKTGKGVYPEVALQLAAYRYADFIGLPDDTEGPIPDVFGCAVVHLRPRGYKFIPVTAGQDQFRMFLYAQQVREFTRKGESFIGQAILPGEADPFTGIPSANNPAPVTAETGRTIGDAA